MSPSEAKTPARLPTLPAASRGLRVALAKAIHRELEQVGSGIPQVVGRRERVIHPSAWKVISQDFAFRFSEVRVSLPSAPAHSSVRAWPFCSSKRRCIWEIRRRVPRSYRASRAGGAWLFGAQRSSCRCLGKGTLLLRTLLPYSPECAEGEFSEVRIQHLVWFRTLGPNSCPGNWLDASWAILHLVVLDKVAVSCMCTALTRVPEKGLKYDRHDHGPVLGVQTRSQLT